MRKTKIICTLGPATDNKELLTNIIKAGLDLARFNFSHGTHEECAKRIALLQEATEEVGKVVGLIADTKGPEMRLGIFKNDKVTLTKGEKFCLTTKPQEGDEHISYVNYDRLHEEVQVGDEILLNDGKLTLEVTSIEGTSIHTVVTNGGEISSRKRVAVPGAILKLPFMSEQDVADITFAAQHHMDYVAASFVRNAEDAWEIRRLLESLGSSMGIIAKIENQEGVDNIDSILEVVDGVMVARGDLGVEIPAEEVPIVQKKIIAKCNAVGKPVVTATQMLESMISNYRATRAEASDVANSIFDGTDAIMLSGETASGSYPLEAVETMAKIALRTEAALNYAEVFRHKGLSEGVNVSAAVSHAAVQIAQELDADVILPITESGLTARMIAKYRPHADVVAVSPQEESLRRMTLYWGVRPLLGVVSQGTDDLIAASVKKALTANLVHMGDSVIVTAGVNVGQVGSTNLLKVISIGTKVAGGVGIGKKSVTGKVCRIENLEDLAKLTPDSIMVVAGLENAMGLAASKVKGIVAQEGGFTSQAAIVGINCGIPVIVGVEGAMEKLTEDEEITLDVSSGSIYSGKINVK